VSPLEREKLPDFTHRLKRMSLEDFRTFYKAPFLLLESHAHDSSSDAFPISTPSETLQQEDIGRVDFTEQFVSSLEKTDKNEKKNITLGRAIENDIFVPHRAVSKFHAEFFRDGVDGLYHLMDLGSTNGTTLERAPLVANTPVSLDNQQTMIFGGHVRGTFFYPKDFYNYVQFLARIGKIR
jgi:pSer/pThr/pTyr-binding forkhead associated (FHA) protein